MSATSEPNTAARPNRPAHVASEDAKSNGAETAKPVATPAVVDLGTNTTEIADTELELPVRFGAGQVMDATLANLVDTFFLRSFTRQQDAAAKLRAENLGKAKTAEDKAKYQPLTVADLQKLYADFVPPLGGTRMSTMDKIRADAAWQTWQDLIEEHNACLDRGEASTVFKNDTSRRGILLRKTDGVTVEMYREQKSELVLNAKSARIQGKLQANIDAAMAARKAAKEKTTPDTVVVLSTETADDFA
jgi:hypothetical protein